jgi:hypothetical protein
LLLQRLADNPAIAISLLEPGNAVRELCIEWITKELARQAASSESHRT